MQPFDVTVVGLTRSQNEVSVKQLIGAIIMNIECGYCLFELLSTSAAVEYIVEGLREAAIPMFST